MEDQQFCQLLQHLGLSWTGYRKVRKGVKKRIARHMQDFGCRNVSAYLVELDRRNNARRDCERLMTVSISRFFRDRKLWETLQKDILPVLVETHHENIKVWSAGCASGEEVYTLKILWDVLEASTGRLPYLEVLATDMNPDYLERAKAGVYPLSSLKEVSEQLRSVYFQVQARGKRHAVKSSLKKGIMWREHHLLSDPPGSQFRIIFLRNNLLTYYRDELKRLAFRKALASLSTGGFLIIGSHEKLPFETAELLPFGSLSFVFKKVFAC
jgi:chemotaxis protein methyltransferase CheR